MEDLVHSWAVCKLSFSKSLSVSLKSHINVLCALKLTELRNTSLVFDLNYKFINGNLAFIPG